MYMMNTKNDIDALQGKVAEASATLRLMANEKRLLVLCQLALAGEMSVGALAEAVGLSQSALSQHLARLRVDGLVAARREAKEASGIEGLTIDPVPVLLSRHEVPSCGPIRPSHHLHVQYVALAPPGSHPVISYESDELEWFAIGELPTDTDDSVRALIAAGTRRLRGNP